MTKNLKIRQAKSLVRNDRVFLLAHACTVVRVRKLGRKRVEIETQEEGKIMMPASEAFIVVTRKKRNRVANLVKAACEASKL